MVASKATLLASLGTLAAALLLATAAYAGVRDTQELPGSFIATEASSVAKEDARAAPADVRIAELIPSDLNGDGSIDLIDLDKVARSFGPADGAASSADVNGDGVVDVSDLAIVSRYHGAS